IHNSTGQIGCGRGAGAAAGSVAIGDGTVIGLVGRAVADGEHRGAGSSTGTAAKGEGGRGRRSESRWHETQKIDSGAGAGAADDQAVGVEDGRSRSKSNSAKGVICHAAAQEDARGVQVWAGGDGCVGGEEQRAGGPVEGGTDPKPQIAEVH